MLTKDVDSHMPQQHVFLIATHVQIEPEHFIHMIPFSLKQIILPEFIQTLS